MTAEATGGAAAVTAVTCEAPWCNGCTLRLLQAGWDGEAWSTSQKTVRDGEVTFRVPQSRTRGMSVAITTPWQGGTDYVTDVGFEYSGFEPGDPVSFGEVRQAKKASTCWAGTSADAATIPLSIRRVAVPGYDGSPIPAAIVCTTVTQDAMVPMQKTFRGIVCSQDVNVCGPR